MADLNHRVTQELNELYEGKYLRRPSTQYNADDDIQKETDELIKYGIEVNTERNKKGLPPIDSIAKIYFMHYKPFKEAQGKTKTDQPPGADAPIAGANSPASVESSNQGYVYARDHKKSYRQILEEAFRRNKK